MVAAGFLVFFSALPASAAVITVYPSGDSIKPLQDAVDRAQPGDTIIVGDGVYKGTLNLSGKYGSQGSPITIQSQNPKGATIVGPASAPAVSAWGVEHVAVRDFTVVSNATSGDNGAFKIGGPFTRPATGVVIEGNHITGQGLDGIKFMEGATGNRIVGNLIDGNWQEEAMDNVSVENMLISNNTVKGSAGNSGLTYKAGSNGFTITNNIFDIDADVQISNGGYGDSRASRWDRMPDQFKLGDEARNSTVTNNYIDGNVRLVSATNITIENNEMVSGRISNGQNVRWEGSIESSGNHIGANNIAQPNAGVGGTGSGTPIIPTAPGTSVPGTPTGPTSPGTSPTVPTVPVGSGGSGGSAEPEYESQINRGFFAGIADAFERYFSSPGATMEGRDGVDWLEKACAENADCSAYRSSSVGKYGEDTLGAFRRWVGGNCFGCELVSGFLLLGDKYAKETYVLLAPSVRSFATNLFALYVLYQFLTIAMPFGQAGSVQPFRRIMITSIYFVFVNFALSTPGIKAYWYWVYEPVIEDSSTIAANLLAKSAVACSDSSSFQLKTPAEFSYPESQFKNVAPNASTGLSGLPVSAYNAILCQMSNMQKLAGIGIITGGQTIIKAWEYGLSDIFKAFVQVFCGIFIVIPYGLALATLGYFIIDVFIKIIAISAIMPLLLLGLIIPVMRSWFVRAVMGIVQAGFTFIIASVLYGITGFVLCNVPLLFGIPSAEEWMTQVSDENWTMSFSSAKFWALFLAATFLLGAMRRASAMSASIFGSSFDVSSVGHVAGTGIAAATTMATRVAVVGGAAAGASALVNQFSARRDDGEDITHHATASSMRDQAGPWSPNSSDNGNDTPGFNVNPRNP